MIEPNDGMCHMGPEESTLNSDGTIEYNAWDRLVSIIWNTRNRKLCGSQEGNFEDSVFLFQIPRIFRPLGRLLKSWTSLILSQFLLSWNVSKISMR